jgi:hypothetical protein
MCVKWIGAVWATATSWATHTRKIAVFTTFSGAIAVSRLLSSDIRESGDEAAFSLIASSADAAGLCLGVLSGRTSTRDIGNTWR